MKNSDIIHALAQKVTDTIYKGWHHEGHIENEGLDSFHFTLDGKLYCVVLTEKGEMSENV